MNSLLQPSPTGYNGCMDERRLRLLGSTFRDSFGPYDARRSIFVGRAPGRVNLIGEHTDYNGCPVLPMALEHDAAALCFPREDRIFRICNTDSGFGPLEFEVEREIAPFVTGHWGNYCKAGVQTAVDYLVSTDFRWDGFRGADVAVDGTVPQAAGLSSSSALVVLLALVSLAVNGCRVADGDAAGPGAQHAALLIDPFDLAQRLAAGERYVGTQGGGMDQAASLLSRAGSALKIDFNPFAVRPVRMPEGFVPVVANSMVQAPKTREAMDRYNLRTVECRLGVALIREEFRRRFKRDPVLRLIGDLSPGRLGVTEAEIDEVVAAAIGTAPYRLSDVASAVKIPVQTISEQFCKRRDGSTLPEPSDGLKIAQRVRHVREEWKRVELSAELLDSGDALRFASLMTDSHESCRDLFEISCPELDSLVDIALSSGALGSRLTGAGFGGCTVSLVRETGAESFMKSIRRKYHNELLHLQLPDDAPVVFVCRPGGGAWVKQGPPFTPDRRT